MLKTVTEMFYFWLIFWPYILGQKVSDDDITEAFIKASATLGSEIKEKFVQDEGVKSQCKYSGSGGNVAYQNTFERYQKDLKMQEILEETTRILQRSKKLTPDEVNALGKKDLRNVLPKFAAKCWKAYGEVQCNENYPYRSFDGTCNNLKHWDWGKSFSCFQRMFTPVYSDGISELRKSIDGDELPDFRLISSVVDPEEIAYLRDLTIIFMQFGQLVSHDFGFTPQLADTRIGPVAKCCDRKEKNEYCAPLNISASDPFYNKYGVTCLNNARSLKCLSCKLGPRGQLNAPTSFIDVSMIYGVNKEQSDQLRSLNGKGTLKYTNDSEAGMLPPQSSVSVDDQCSFQKNNSKRCFESGDVRVNQHKMITAFQTLFLRQHNYVAGKLAPLNKNWDEETLFQETRRIIDAQLQMITYSAFLPKLLGEDVMNYFDLFVKEGTFYTKYNERLNPTIRNEFAASAYRFGHSLIPKIIPHVFKHITYEERMKNFFIWPFDFYKNNYIEELLKGMSLNSPQLFDRFVVTDVTNYLNHYRGNSTGSDLVSRDLFRERDHGIPPYVDILRYCTGQIITSFDDLKPLFRENTVEYYQSVYENVADIEFLSAAYSEKPVEGGIVGPTIACIVGTQFQLLKYGDRFYFEHGGQINPFTEEQLTEIKKTTLAKIICDTTKIETIQEDVMMKPSNINPVKHCKNIPDIDWSVFSR